MSLSPIALFVYNRPEHTQKTIKALQKNKLAPNSELFIFSDGPRTTKDEKNVKLIRDYIKNITGFKKIVIEEKNKNQGLADSITGGVTKIVNKYGKIIVLEDDIVTSPYFLNYMNDALNLYKNEPQVMHIAGYLSPIKKTKLPETFFYNQASCWGWATWKRAWKYFDNDANRLYTQIKEKKLTKQFNSYGGGNNFENQLISNISGEIKTWAIKWQASVFLQNGLCLHPNRSLVENIGFDGTGENCSKKNIYDIKLSENKIIVKRINLIESKKAKAAIKKFYQNLKPKLIYRIINFLKNKL